MGISSDGHSASAIEITNISAHGIRIYIRGKEFFMSYEDFPWLKDQTVRAMTNVEELGESGFHWPDIDVDLTEEMIEFSERFPLKANRKT